MNKIETLLEEKGLEINHLTDPKLWANALREILSSELISSKNINFLEASSDTIAMIKVMNKMDSKASLKLCVNLLVHFETSNNFDLTLISDPYTKAELEK